MIKLLSNGPLHRPGHEPISRRMDTPLNTLDTIEEAIAAIAAGELVVVVDDTDRENEGDLIMAAAKATPEQIAFMIRHTSGIICAPMPSRARRRAEPRADGRQQPRPDAHRLHRLGRLPGRPDHRHLGRGAHQHGARARQRQLRGRRLPAARPHLPADRARRRRARPARATPRPASTSRASPGCRRSACWPRSSTTTAR